MKKLFAMALASAMVLSMASVASAATEYNIMLKNENSTDTETVYHEKSLDWDNSDTAEHVTDFTESSYSFGDTVYYALRGTLTGKNNAADKNKGDYLVYESNAVKGLKIKATWIMGKEYVKGVSVVKKKVNDAANFIAATAADSVGNLAGAKHYAYFIAVELNDSMTTSKKYISGEIELDKSRGNTDYDDSIKDYRFNVDVDVQFPERTDNNVYEDKSTMVFNDDEEDEILLIGGDSTGSADESARFVVNTMGQDKLVMACNTDFVADVAAKYPSANLEFMNVTSGTFNKIGTLYVLAEEGHYLYTVDSNGTLKKVNAKYDSTEEAFVLKTRNLGSYVISDQKLDLADVSSGSSNTDAEVEAPAVEAPAVEAPTTTAPTNPATGAAC